MRKTMKRFLMAALGAFAFVATGFGMNALQSVDVAKAENADLIIKGKTLNVSNNVNVVFFVPASAGAKENITVHVTEKQASGDVTATISADEVTYTESGVEYYRFIYRGVAAYEISNDLIAYAQLGEEKSPEIKYSVLEYAYKKLGKADKSLDETAGLENLLNTMLDYASAAAAFNGNTVDYKTDYTYVSIENATFEDGFNYGLYKVGETLTVTPDTGFGLADGASGFVDNGAGGYTYEVPAEKPDLSGSFEETETLPADMIAHEKGALTLDFTEAKVGDVKTLPIAADAFDQVTITWSATNATNATIEENVVTFTAVGTATLTATFSCDGAEAQTKDFTLTAYTTEERTYTFSNYTAGTQYAEETHALDSDIDLKVVDCHLTSELRIYSSSTNNGIATIVARDGITISAITVNAGYKADTLNIYGSNDGTSYTSETVATITTTSSYNDYSSTIDGDYQYLKLDIAGANQVRIKTMTLALKITSEAPAPVEPTEEEKIEATKAELDALEIPETVTGEWSITLPSVGENYSDVEITWDVTANSELAAYDAETGKLTIKEPTADAELTLELSATLVCGESQDQWELAQTITIDYQEPAGGGDSGEGGDETPADPIVFELGTNGTASHSDGSSKTSYSETVGDYTLSITGGTQFYTGARDALGNSCIKLGSSKNSGSFTFTVDSSVVQVVIKVARYKSNESSVVTINGNQYTLTTTSDSGEYTEITIDTSVTKTITVTSGVSGDKRAMINTIEFYV